MSASFMTFNISHQEAHRLVSLTRLELIKETRMGTIRDLYVDDISSLGDGICFCILWLPLVSSQILVGSVSPKNLSFRIAQGW